MEPDMNLLASLLPSLSAQMRIALSNLHFAAAQLVPSQNREQDPALDAQAARLDQSYYQLLRLVNNLTAAACLDGRHTPRLRSLDIVALARELFTGTEDLAALRGLTLKFVCPMEQHFCAADRADLEQLLYQLLSNAFKFTPPGGTVTLELKCIRDRVLLSVSDTGCGIAPDELKTLFDRCLSSETLPAPPQGLGLGLLLCRHIAESHGGVLLADSTPGKGSRFTLSLPDVLPKDAPVSDVPFDYAGGFHRALLQLADALPSEAYLIRNQL